MAYSPDFENDAPLEAGTLGLPIGLLNTLLKSDGTVLLDAQHNQIPSSMLPTTATRSLEEPSVTHEFLTFSTEKWHLEKDGILHIPNGAIMQIPDKTDRQSRLAVLPNGAPSRERVTGPICVAEAVIEQAFGTGYQVLFIPLAMRKDPLPVREEFGYAPMSNIRGAVIAAPRMESGELPHGVYWHKIGMYWSETCRNLCQLKTPGGILVGNRNGVALAHCENNNE